MYNVIAHHLLTDAHPIPKQRPYQFIVPHDATWCGTSLWSAWITCPDCVPSQLLVHPQASLLAGHNEKLKGPYLSVSTALQQLKHQCVISIIFILNPKHSTYRPL